MKLRLLDKYLGKQVIGIILVVSLALLGFDYFFNLVHELKMVGKGNYTLWQAFSFLLLTAPSRLYSLFPWAALIGSLIALGGLAHHSELVVMRTASISIFQIVSSVLKAAVVLVIIVVFVGEVIAPSLEQYAQNRKTFYVSSGKSLQTVFGLWVKQGNEFLQIQRIDQNGDLYGITRYEFDNQRRLIQASVAEKATKIGEKWVLQNVKGTTFLGNRTQAFLEDEQLLPFSLNKEVLEASMIKHPERLSLPALWRVLHHPSSTEINTQSYELALWVKLLQPVVILMMVFLGAPFVFGPLRGSKSMGVKILVGVLIAFLFHTVNNLFAPLAVVYQFPPIIAVLTPILVFSTIGVLLLRRAR